MNQNNNTSFLIMKLVSSHNPVKAENGETIQVERTIHNGPYIIIPNMPAFVTEKDGEYEFTEYFFETIDHLQKEALSAEVDTEEIEPGQYF